MNSFQRASDFRLLLTILMTSTIWVFTFVALLLFVPEFQQLLPLAPVQDPAIEIHNSNEAINHVDFRCPNDTELISAVCNAKNPYPQVAVGPRYNADRSFSCDKYTSQDMMVQATAICIRKRVKSNAEGR